MAIPAHPKIYHIVHVDRLPSIIADGGLFSDAIMSARPPTGTAVGMQNIKTRRLGKPLETYPELMVGGCVPFYFCPRSIMLFVLSCKNNPDLIYTGGQEPMVHLELDFHTTIKWANDNAVKWVFTDMNAGSAMFEDFNDLTKLDRIDWDAVNTKYWQNCKDGKQAEFLVENSFPWQLVERIGVHSHVVQAQVKTALAGTNGQLSVEIKRDWYY